jgi:Lrp/AsnC family transcriptional regulator for asnA, asnC and gidA
VTEALKQIPEVVECHFTTGQYDMFVKIYAKNNHHLLSIIHDKLQPLGLSRSETLISFNEAIKRQMPILNIADDDEENDTLNEPAATPESEKPERGRKAKGK